MKIFSNIYLKILLLVLITILVSGIVIYTYTSKSFFNTPNNNPPSHTQQFPKTENTKTSPSENQPINQPPKNIVKQIPEYKVKGIYLTGWTAGNERKLDHFINLINKTELNTIVIDVKDDEGRVSYKSNVPLVKKIGASYNMINDINKTLKKLKDNKIHTIARIVVFKDPKLAEKMPDFAIKTTSGSIWRDRKHAAWINPYNKESWKYSLDIAKEAVQLGFDEIQFDYIRFPTDGKVKQIDYGPMAKNTDMTKPINEFLAQAKKELNELGVPVSADVFGIITTNIGDIEKIGQDLESISQQVDYISPMVYPSHYAFGQYGIRRPDLEPYKIVYKSLSTAKARLDKLTGHKAKIRPYLQDFTAVWLGKGNYKIYTAQDVRNQIKAVYDCGLDEWILWNALNKYNENALLPE